MKKLLASILCILMILSIMSFTAFAETPAERSILATASTDELYADQTVDITLNLTGDNLANAEWTLEYNKDYFELTAIDGEATSDTYDGVISDIRYKEDGSVYDNGYSLTTYTFKALAQTTEVTGNFEVTSAEAYTYLESIRGDDIIAGTNSVPVTILLYDYEISVEFDGVEITDAEMTAQEKSLPYDNDTHTFQVTTIPQATVTYWVNGEQKSEVEIKNEGEYTITYKVESPEIGFAPVEETFTIKVTSPEYVIEVGAEDYVPGYKIVLAYTNTPGVYFNYAGFPMTDVSVSDYTYEGTDYDRIFAFVIDANTGTSDDDFKSCVSHIYDDTDTKVLDGYDADLNFENELTVQDITVGFGVYNVVPEYYQSDIFQKNILKTDITNDKMVRLDDTRDITNKVLYPQN